MNLKQSIALHHCLKVLEALDSYNRKTVVEALVELERPGSEPSVQVRSLLRARPERKRRTRAGRHHSAANDRPERVKRAERKYKGQKYSIGPGTLANDLREIRQAEGISQRDMASKLKIHRTLIGLYETGIVYPTDLVLRKQLTDAYPQLARHFQGV